MNKLLNYRYFQVNDPTKEVVLNCLDIKISSATYCNNDGSILESSNISFDEPQETVTLQFPEELKSGYICDYAACFAF